MLAWDFNSQTRLHFDPVPKDGPPVLLGEFLTYLVRRRRGLHVNVLNWDYPMVLRHGVVPVQHIDVQAAPAPHQISEKFAEQHRRAVFRHRIEKQARLAVEVPGEHEDRALRAQRRLVERLEIILGVDDSAARSARAMAQQL